MTTPYTPETQENKELTALPGPTLVEFGTNWCGHCQAAQPVIAKALENRTTTLKHIKVEDGSGRPLGRSFKVKLWPTLIFLKDGVEVARLVRPTDSTAVTDALTTIGA
jgi:thioredoxin 1